MILTCYAAKTRQGRKSLNPGAPFAISGIVGKTGHSNDDFSVLVGLVIDPADCIS